MKSKFWLRAAWLVVAVVMVLTVVAGCGTGPAESDPDANSQDTSVSTTTGDVQDTTTAGDTQDTTTAGGDETTTTGTGTNATTTGKNDKPGTTLKTTASKTVTGNALGNVDGGGSTNDVIDSGAALGSDKYKNIAMPTRKLDNKTVVVFSWRDQNSDNCYGGSKPDLRKVYKKVGLKLEWYQATHDNYMDMLAASVVAGNNPDLVEWNATKMYPAAIESGLVVPFDAYIDFNAKIWDDVRALTAKYQINGKTFFSAEYLQIAEFLYYNPKIIKSAGLETPLELWRKGKWTLKALQNIADKTRELNSKGEVTRVGFVPGNIGAITGLEMVEYNRANGYKLNITNSKYKTLMNTMFLMGVNGTKSAGFVRPADVANGTVVMAMTAGWAMTNECNDAREKGNLEWCILPKLDDKSEHYYNVTVQQTFGLLKGAKNPDGAAYVVELRKWAFLNYPWNEALPFTDTAYTREFGEKQQVSGSGDQGTLTAAEIKYTQELLSKGYDVVANNLWGGWVGNGQFPGITEVISNGNQWSTVVANKKATLEAVLKQWDFSKV